MNVALVSSLFVAGLDEKPMAKGEQINLDNPVSGSGGSDGQPCGASPVTNSDLGVVAELGHEGIDVPACTISKVRGNEDGDDAYALNLQE